jgi:hypothetical protein
MVALLIRHGCAAVIYSRERDGLQMVWLHPVEKIGILHALIFK